MGSLFRVPAFKIPDVRQYAEAMRARGVTLYALQTRGGRNLYQSVLKFPALILIGGEAAGIPDDMQADEQITIPMKGKVESLNVAMAGTLCFYRFGMERG
jgi:TrmH family RNA methyltransferase